MCGGGYSGDGVEACAKVTTTSATSCPPPDPRCVLPSSLNQGEGEEREREWELIKKRKEKRYVSDFDGWIPLFFLKC